LPFCPLALLSSCPLALLLCHPLALLPSSQSIPILQHSGPRECKARLTVSIYQRPL
jgi:hypothetical protein